MLSPNSCFPLLQQARFALQNLSPSFYKADVVPNSMLELTHNLTQGRIKYKLEPVNTNWTGMKQTAFKTTEFYTTLELPASVKVVVL